MFELSTEARTGIIIVLTLIAAGCRGTTVPKNDSEPAAQTNAATSATKSTPAPEPTPERPSLSCAVQDLSLYPVPNNRENLAVSLVVSVHNSGAPTMVQDWKLAIQSPSRTDLGSLEPVHVNGVVEMPGAKGARVDLAKEDLVLKSKQTALTKGRDLKGVLTFVLPKTSTQDLSNNRSTFVIYFKDNQGGTYQTRRALIGVKANQ